MRTEAVCDYFVALQKSIVAALEAADGHAFRTDDWTRAEGGGGTTRVIENGGRWRRARVRAMLWQTCRPAASVGTMIWFRGLAAKAPEAYRSRQISCRCRADRSCDQRHAACIGEE